MTEKILRLKDTTKQREIAPELDMTRICYWRGPDRWYLYLPRGGLGDLSQHEVEEHEDGTITVTPSILVTAPNSDRRRHGFIRRGIWEPCGDDRPIEEEK